MSICYYLGELCVLSLAIFFVDYVWQTAISSVGSETFLIYKYFLPVIETLRKCNY